MDANIPNLLSTLRLKDPVEAIRKALKNPIGTPPLKDLAKGKKDAVIVINDITRPYSSKMLVTEITIELNEWELMIRKLNF